MMQFLKTNKYLLIVITIAILFVLFQLNLFNFISWEQYPYLHQDFWRKMEDAQFYMGTREAGQFHPPVIPVLYALFKTLGISQLYFINYFFSACFAILLFLIVRRFTKNEKIGVIISIIYLSNYFIIQQSNYLGLADLTSIFFITLATYIFIISDSMKKLALSGLIFGIAGLVQYSGVFGLPFIFILLLLKKGSVSNKLKSIFVFFLPAILVFGSFFIYRFVEFGDPFYSNIEHFGFLEFGINNLPFYLFTVLAIFSIPFTIIALFGLKDLFKSKVSIKFILLILPSAIFFVFFYKWADWRFLVYLIPIFYVTLAFGVKNVLRFNESLRVNKLFVYLVIILLILSSNLYLSGNIGIIVSSKTLMVVDTSFDNGIPTHRLVTRKDIEITPYFLLNNNWKGRTANDEELKYFMDRTNYQDVKELSEIIRDSAFVLILENEKFVRYHQFNVATKRHTIMDPNETELQNAKFIVSDKFLNLNDFDLLRTFENLYLYKKVDLL